MRAFAAIVFFAVVVSASVPVMDCADNRNVEARDGAIMYKHLRVELVTSSDWSTFEIDETIPLTMHVVSVSGNPTKSSLTVDGARLEQPRNRAEENNVISMTVEYAIPARLGLLECKLTRGALNSTLLSVYAITDADTILLNTTRHEGVVESNTDFNPFSVHLDLSSQECRRSFRPESGPMSKRLLAFYYPWYRHFQWETMSLVDHPAQRYTSDDTDVVRRHIRQAKSSGIDAFVSSWWGPKHYTDANLRLLLDLAYEADFEVSIYLETLQSSEMPRDPVDIQAWLEYFFDTYASHPALLRVDGRPVIFLWASNYLPLDTWANIFARLSSEGDRGYYVAMGYDLSVLRLFDGMHEYGIFALPQLDRLYINLNRVIGSYQILSPESRKLFVATVQPGYDERGLEDRAGLFQERTGGKFYRSTFEAAVSSGALWIVITSWNEWFEHSYIEPSEMYKDHFLVITREYAERWKYE